MRPPKTQFKSIFIFNDPLVAQVFWDRRYSMMAGYTDYDVFIVGAAGGRSGDAWGEVSSDRAYASGAGGGGSLRLKGKLSALALDVSIIGVGAEGAAGATSASNEAPAGHGQAGGSSVFQNGVIYEAHGGGGALGADFNITTSSDFTAAGEGGDGGGNSAGLGAGGVGGRATKSDPDGDVAGTAPSIGTWAVGGVAPVVGGGHGGGGGPGKVKVAGRGLIAPPYAGSDGTSGAPTWCTGFGGAPGTNGGGDGGGAGIGDFLPGVPLEAADIYGSGQSAAPNNPGGVVCIKVS